MIFYYLSVSVFHIFQTQRTASSVCLKQNEGQRTGSSGYFKSLKEPEVIMKELVKNRGYKGGHLLMFDIFLRTVVVHHK